MTEASPGDPDAVAAFGLALSGGGLRAAAFGLGALQALDGELGAVRGPGAADYLACVSGGSYTAAAVTLFLHSDRFEGGTAPLGRPFAPGSPEATHLAANSDYLSRDGRWRLLGSLLAAIAYGIVAAGSVLLWPAVVSGFLGQTWRNFEPLVAESQTVTRGLGLVAAALWALALFHIITRRPFTNRALVVWTVSLMSLLPSLSATVSGLAPLRSPRWAERNIGWLLVALAVTVAAHAVWSFFRPAPLGARSVKTALLEGLTNSAVRWLQALMVVGSAWVIAAYATDSPSLLQILLLGVVLIMYGFVTFHAAGDIVSSFWLYRDRLTRFFAVIHTDDGVRAPVDPHAVLLSALEPDRYAQAKTPELLVCATANMTTPRRACPRSGAVSMVMTPSVVHLHLDGGYSMATRQFERFGLPADLNGSAAPALSLSAAVALTGAAASPAMGKLTQRHLRTLFVILNVRLGRWLPNLANAEIRRLADGDEVPNLRIDGADLLREFVGSHSASSPLVYVSDGGHYDNLGLVELLRRRCRLIVSIDASGDPIGVPRTLSAAIELARDELDTAVEIDLDRFARSSDNRRHLAHTHAVGSITYPGGSVGHLVVLKIGLAPTSAESVKASSKRWRRFPNHGTYDQFYTSERFDAYRALGYDTAAVALTDGQVDRVLRLGG